MGKKKSKNGKKKSSGDPRVSDVSAWKRRQDAVVISLPSGEKCLARRVGMKVFLKVGVVPDYLATTVQKLIAAKQGGPPSKVFNEMAKDTQAVLKTEELMDRALCMTVVQPRVVMPPGCAYKDSSGKVCGKWLAYNDADVHNHESDFFDHDYVLEERSDEVLYADEVDMEDKLFLFNWSVGGGADLDTFRKQWAESMAALEPLEGDELPSKQPAESGG